MPRSIEWADGASWAVDEPTFQRATEQLRSVQPVIWGLEPIMDRWAEAAAHGDRISVDRIAPSEDERAVLTAGLERAVEHAKQATPSDLGFEDAAQYNHFLSQLSKLHELFATDVTYSRAP